MDKKDKKLTLISNLLMNTCCWVVFGAYPYQLYLVQLQDLSLMFNIYY